MRRVTTGRLPLVLWLAAVWVLLWRSLSPLVLLSALVVVPLCLAACRLPPLELRSHPRWGDVIKAVGHFGAEVLVSSVQVAWATLRRGPRTRSAIVAVPVRSSSDVALTVAANRLSLVPGTLVLDLDRDPGTLFLYVLDVRQASDVDRARRDARRGTSIVLRAFGQEAESAGDPESAGDVGTE